MRGDFHIHTNISDGSDSIEDVLIKARKNKVSHLAITNHDTVIGIEEGIELGKRFNIKVIPGIEISAYDYENKRKVHILGYKFNLDAPNIKKLCDPLLKARNENTLRQLSVLLSEGYKLDVVKILDKGEKGTALYKQHIMDEMIRKGYTDSIYSALYKKLFKGDGPCAGDVEYVDVYDAIRAIKDDGGLAVLAHPGQQDTLDIVPELVSNGLDGIELNHSDNSPKDRKRIRQLAKDFSLILTGGTDYHGKYGEDINIGEIECPKNTVKLF